MAAELAVGADLASDARHFAGERVELIHHGVDRVLQLQNFAADVDGDFARQVALRHRRGDLGDIADLAGQVARHGVDRIREVLPDAADAFDLRLAAELAFGSHFSRHARHFAGERIELIDHGVDRVLQLQNFAAGIHRDLRREIALRHGCGDAGDIADLVGEIAGHGIHALREVAPRSRDAFHFRLTAEFAFGPYFASHASHFRGERAELVHHRVDRVLQLENLAANGDGDLPRQVAPRDSGGDLGDVSNLSGEVPGHRIDRIRQILPGAGHSGHIGLTAEQSLGSDFARNTGHLGCKRAELVHHRVDRVLQLQNFAARVDADPGGQVALSHGRGHFGDVSNLVGEIAGHGVDRIRQVFPHAGHFGHVRLAAQQAFGADLTSYAGHFGCKRAELVDHGVDRVFQLEDFSLRVNRDAGGQIAFRHGRGHAGDVAHLIGQVAGHRVHTLGEILPRTRDTGDHRLTAQLALRPYFSGDTGRLGGERIELIHHRVDHARRVQKFSA